MSTAPAAGTDERKEKKSKSRLSNLFGAHKDKADHETVAPTVSARARDSAYGSETDTSPAMSQQTVPTITQGQADMQGAPTETKVDNRGRVVTVTTTTVTTTTTTTTGEPITVPPGEEVIVTKDQSTTENTPMQDAAHPPVPAKSAARPRSPYGEHLAPANPPVVQQAEPSSPTSPTHQNFSYPGRQQTLSPNGRKSSLDQMHTPIKSLGPDSRAQGVPDSSYRQGQPSVPRYAPGGPTDAQMRPTASHSSIPESVSSDSPYQQRQSTAQSIRTAAAGIHGAGEALRGAFNSSIARHVGASPAEIAQYDAVAERGRREIETGQFHKANVPAVPPVPVEPDAAPATEKKSSVLRNVLRKKSRERAI